MNSDPHDRAGDTATSDTMRAALERQLHDPGEEGAACTPPPVPDHALLRRIGHGAYGDVWLARNALGTLRAVKVIYRARFKEDRPYERELHGILKFEPVSRSHEGLVQVLHVGRNDQAGCFYYVMELADAVEQAGTKSLPGKPAGRPAQAAPGPPNADPPVADYSPRTLHSELARCQRLPPMDAAQLVLRLAGALAHLHSHGLVHRDIKPSNVIFVGGQPKLADIGLVTDVGSSHSFVGTEGFIPPEGPGTPQADLYGLGKLLYELATGRDRMDFPQLPPLSSLATPDGEALLELNEVMTRACAPEPKQRYANARELQADLNLFLAGRSLRRARNVERHLASLKTFAVAACIFLAVGAGALWFAGNQARHAREKARQAEDRARIEAESREKEATLRQRAEAAEQGMQQQLYTALLEQARATVLSGEMGRRVRALDAIRRASVISNSVELRREALVALSLPDLRLERELPYGEEFTARELDPSFQRIALCRNRGPVQIRSTSDNKLIATLPASTNLPSYDCRWNVDGQYLAVKRDRSNGGWRTDWEFWDVAASRQVLLFQDLPAVAVAFHPRLPRILIGQRTGDVSIWSLEDGRELVRLPRIEPAAQLEFAPEGGRFAVTRGKGHTWTLSVHNATNGLLLASAVFSNSLPMFQWHPGGRWLAVAENSGAVHWMDAHTSKSRVLGRHKAEARRVEFSPDGGYLISGAWGGEMICWDAQTLQRAFDIALNSHLGQFRADGRAYAVATAVGVQLHAFERPGVHREFAEDLGIRLAQAAFSTDGRWLAASADKRMGVWDLTAGGPGALEEKAYEAHCFFTSDGRELFGSRNGLNGDNAGFRWRVTPATEPGGPPLLERLRLHKPAGFASLSLNSNTVVMISTNGTQLLARDEIEMGNNDWRPTYAGMNRVSPDGRWLGIFRHYTSSLYIHRMPDLERASKLTQLPQLGNINFFEFSPSGKEVALYSQRGVEFWSTETWERTRVLTNFGRPLLYAPDGRSLWLTKGMRAAGLYDAQTLEPRLLLPTGMLPLAVSGDGRSLAVSVDGQRLQVWALAEMRKQLRGVGLDWAAADTQGISSP